VISLKSQLKAIEFGLFLVLLGMVLAFPFLMKALQENDPSWPSLMLKVWFLLSRFFFLMQLRL
jgi:hypothetical protein